MPSVLQPWACDLTFMQQSVLIAAVRGPDGLRKDHPVKVIMRWYRRCILYSALNKCIFADPFTKGGGSFTGPFEQQHADEMGLGLLCSLSSEARWVVFDGVRKVYLRHVDEMPHHFQLHMMHAAEILGFKYPDITIREWWHEFYRMIVNDAHLEPESEERMDFRLGDVERQWRACEIVTAI